MTPVHDDEARAARLQAARAMVGGLLAGNPEARSLLSEASHWRGLAAQSAALAATASRAADLARLRYEELRHCLDPRGHLRARYGVACALVAAIGLALAGLAWIELAPWIDVTGPRGLAGRRRRSGRLAVRRLAGRDSRPPAARPAGGRGGRPDRAAHGRRSSGRKTAASSRQIACRARHRRCCKVPAVTPSSPNHSR
jgi:hypothetical protein